MQWSRALASSATTSAARNGKSPAHVAVLGGGLTGLAAAHHVRRSLPLTKVSIIEASPRFGGWMESTTHHVAYKDPQDGHRKTGRVVLEGGPRSIRPNRSAAAAIMLKMIRDVSLEKSVVPVLKTSPSARNRYFLDFNTDPPSLQPVTVSSALGLDTFLSGLKEPLGLFFKRIEDESVDSFLRRKLGSKVAELASTGLHGVYAASSTDLSAQAILGGIYKLDRQYGSIILGAMLANIFPSAAKRAFQHDIQTRWQDLCDIGVSAQQWASYGFRNGLQTLTEVLQSRLQDSGVEMRSSERIRHIEVSSDFLSITTDKERVNADHVISCLSSGPLSTLLSSPLPNLTANPSTSVGVINFVFPRAPADVQPQAFGYLVPRSSTAQNPAGILGVVFDSTALPGLEEDPGLTKMTVMMGGPYWSTYPEDGTPNPLPSPSSPEELVSPALEHLRQVFPVLKDVEPALVVPRLQRDCIPTFRPGHYARIYELHEAIKSGPWSGKLSLAGASYYGPSVNDCVASAAYIAEALERGESPTGLEWIEQAM